MEHYIKKSALVAEIEARYNECLKRAKICNANYWNGNADAYRNVLGFLDTLEVKGVDLEKVYKDFINSDNGRSMFETAKYFFELGLKVNKSLTWEDIANINEIVNEILKECGKNILYDTQENFCKEVLKRFKVQKGE